MNAISEHELIAVGRELVNHAKNLIGSHRIDKQGLRISGVSQGYERNDWSLEIVVKKQALQCIARSVGANQQRYRIDRTVAVASRADLWALKHITDLTLTEVALIEYDRDHMSDLTHIETQESDWKTIIGRSLEAVQPQITDAEILCRVTPTENGARLVVGGDDHEMYLTVDRVARGFQLSYGSAQINDHPLQSLTIDFEHQPSRLQSHTLGLACERLIEEMLAAYRVKELLIASNANQKPRFTESYLEDDQNPVSHVIGQALEYGARHNIAVDPAELSETLTKMLVKPPDSFAFGRALSFEACSNCFSTASRPRAIAATKPALGATVGIVQFMPLCDACARDGDLLNRLAHSTLEQWIQQMLSAGQRN